ncbi:BDH_1b_G0040840.mRNA.1.CDS.1 [Saccharomyces cerevisiae]|nr:Glo1p [Saccharomyces cerevisiae YJM555]AJS87186.1 Glo1p [Saccharomyces cerevisiae YJM1383]AJS99380.1 Glo1p [Saccharomyces cerevisiae YJM1549]CAI4669418.1 BDH_1b_G0040840.mRNA.1.CDS.1 [Saccharomyces cerevisiae]CAI7269184.1 BDH_1b_G0040840.mRNA.1.CDS.1 [Saccharomyces cerevisiae]
MSTDSTRYPIQIEKASNDPTLLLNHTCLRVKDPARAVKFYTEHFGMKLLSRKDFEEAKFSLYFLSFPKDDIPKNKNGEPDVFSAHGVLELTHNWGTEKNPDYKINNGNEEPHRGFGHICFSVSDINKTCEELESQGVKFKKRLSEGRQKDVAFALDPDGYWIELITYSREGQEYPKGSVGNKFNHTMIRIKNPTRSLEFYQNVLGMKLLRTSEHESAKFTLYFLGYGVPKTDSVFSCESVLELTHNWGTENDPNFHYHNGNSEPQGYGHICISCDDAGALCKEIEVKYGDKIQWSPKFNQGRMKNIAFLKDPDGYSIEVVPHGLIA